MAESQFSVQYVGLTQIRQLEDDCFGGARIAIVLADNRTSVRP